MTTPAPAVKRGGRLPIDHEAVERVLLVALDNLGDLVFASALAPPLQAAFPRARVDVWCKSYTAPIARLVPAVNDVIHGDPFWAMAPGRPRSSVSQFLRSVREVRRRRYDLAVLSEAPWRVAAAVTMAGIPVRIGTARRRNTAFLTQRLPAQDPRKPVVEEQARLLAPLGIASTQALYRLDDSRLGDLPAQVLRQLPGGFGARFAALHPWAGDRARCVPLSEWIQLAAVLDARGISVLWIGTHAELGELRASTSRGPGAYVDEVILEAGADGANDPLTVSAAALSMAAIFVGHDSGPLHVAAALGVPVVGIYAPGQPERTFPQGPGPWRMIARPSPVGITAAMMIEAVDALGRTEPRQSEERR